MASQPWTHSKGASGTQLVTVALRRFNRELHTTVVVVTHDQNLAKAGDRMLVIRDGTIREEA